MDKIIWKKKNSLWGQALQVREAFYQDKDIGKITKGPGASKWFTRGPDIKIDYDEKGHDIGYSDSLEKIKKTFEKEFFKYNNLEEAKNNP